MSIKLRAQIEAVRRGEPGWQRAERKLVLGGQSALALLLQELEREEAAFAPHYSDSLHRLAGAVALFGDSRLFTPLARLYHTSRDPRPLALLEQTLCLVEAYPGPRDIQPLLHLLTADLPTADRLRIATLLVALAERSPSPHFGEALALLTYRLGLPLEYLSLHRRLKAALATVTFPLPATASSSAQNLPLPGSKEKPR